MARVRSAVLLVAFAAALAGVPGAPAVAPANDNFASPTSISGEAGQRETNNRDATKEIGEPDHAGVAASASVWFRWTAPRSGRLAIDTCESDFDTVLAVYTGDTLGSLSALAADDNGCAEQSAVELDVTASTVYRIAVDSAAGAKGGIRFAWAMAPADGAIAPPNDHFENAASLSGSLGSVNGANLTATHQPGEPLHAERGGSGSVWYRWIAPTSGTAEFLACSSYSNFDAVLAAYRGTALGALALVDSVDCRPNGGSLYFRVDAGASYALAIDGSGPAQRGSFTLAWHWAADPVFPPTLVTPPSITGSPRAGELLSGQLGVWSGPGPISLVFWWERCGLVACTKIPGTEGARTIQIGVDERLRFAVRAENPGGATTAYSQPVTSPPPPPVNTEPPVITAASLSVGAIVIPDTYGVWRGNLDVYWEISYRNGWQRCLPGPRNCRDVAHNMPDPCVIGECGGFVPIPHRVETDDVGSVLRLVVLATNEGGTSTAVSAPTGIITRYQGGDCVVPRLVGKTLRSARSPLRRADCRLGKVRRAHSRRKAGRIIKQSPPAGRHVPVGTRVNVVVSKGRRR